MFLNVCHHFNELAHGLRASLLSIRRQRQMSIRDSHQPAPLITGDGASWEVPVHVISGDRSLVDPFLEWGFVEGAWPDTDPGLETLGVDYFRDGFIRAYSGS